MRWRQNSISTGSDRFRLQHSSTFQAPLESARGRSPVSESQRLAAGRPRGFLERALRRRILVAFCRSYSSSSSSSPSATIRSRQPHNFDLDIPLFPIFQKPIKSTIWTEIVPPGFNPICIVLRLLVGIFAVSFRASKTRVGTQMQYPTSTREKKVMPVRMTDSGGVFLHIAPSGSKLWRATRFP